MTRQLLLFTQIGVLIPVPVATRVTLSRLAHNKTEAESRASKCKFIHHSSFAVGALSVVNHVKPGTLHIAAMAESHRGGRNASLVSYRRNGKLFSCEPCRKGKLRCDHNSPVCGRCARRNKHSQCVYHPAPLTKTRASPDIFVAPSLPPSSSRASPVQQQTTPISPPSMMPNAVIPDQPSHRSSTSTHSFQGSPALPMTLSAARGTQMLSTASHRSHETYMSRDARTGFLGSTSYSAVYTENSGKQIQRFRCQSHYREPSWALTPTLLSS